MEIRFLVGLNRQDWQQELQGVNAVQAAKVFEKGDFGTYCGIRFSLPEQSIVRFLQQFCKEHFAYWISHKQTGIIILPYFLLEQFVKELLKSSIARTPFVVQLQRLFKNINQIEWAYTSANRPIPIRSPLWMGILNVTPDSFSDGGQFVSVEAALNRAQQLIEEGAHWIDIGGESTRPGAQTVSAQEEWQRIGPVIEALARNFPDVIISVDTYKAEVARKALEAGAHIINDISAMSFDPEMVEVVSHYQVPVVLMHIKGTPRDMQKNPQYHNLMEEILAFLEERIQFAIQHGIRQIIVDPGIGFGKRWEDNFEILRRLGELKVWGFPILLGVSRKSFIGKLMNDPEPSHRLPGTISANLVGWQNGATIFRVHDVGAHIQAFSVTDSTKKMKANFRNN